MNRRELLKTLGMSMTSIAAGSYAPGQLLDLAIEKDFIVPALPDSVYKADPMFLGYPSMYFTGFKQAQHTRDLKGQLLWGVLYDTGEREDLVFYEVTLRLHHEHLRQKSDEAKLRYIETTTTNGMMRAIEILDQIAEDAENGLVATADRQQIPNPDYDRNHLATHLRDEDEDWYCLACSETIPGDNIKIPAKRVLFVSWKDMTDKVRLVDGKADYSELWKRSYPYEPTDVAVAELVKLEANRILGIL